MSRRQQEKKLVVFSKLCMLISEWRLNFAKSHLNLDRCWLAGLSTVTVKWMFNSTHARTFELIPLKWRFWELPSSYGESYVTFWKFLRAECASIEALIPLKGFHGDCRLSMLLLKTSWIFRLYRISHVRTLSLFMRIPIQWMSMKRDQWDADKLHEDLKLHVWHVDEAKHDTLNHC